MLRKALGFTLLLCVALATASLSSAAAPDKYTYTGLATTDGGCAGNTWANDTVTRVWEVKKGPMNGTAQTWRVKRTDKGTFTSIAGPSPGNCASNTSPHGTTVVNGVKGKINGFARGIVTGGTGYNPTAACTGPDCGSTAMFISTHFGAGASWTCVNGGGSCMFSYNYRADPGQNTLYSHWKDAGDETHETFTGDIANS